MTLTIGVCSGLRPAKINPAYSGNRVAIRGTVVGADEDELEARRQQLLGYASDEDQDVVPVIFASDATLDGYYRVRGADVRQVGAIGSKRAVFDVDLERIAAAYANPWFELSTQSVVRTNVHGVTAPESIVATRGPQSAGYQFDFRPVLSSYGFAGRTTDTGDKIFVVHNYPAPLAPTSVRFTAPVDKYYLGGCKIEIKYGSTWYPVVGRNVPKATQWRISNGLVRLTSTPDGSTTSTFEAWDGSAWDSTSAGYNGGPFGSIHGHNPPPPLAVLRNSPEEVIVREARDDGHHTFSLQRGARIVVISWSTTIGSSLRMNPVSSIASTSITAGIRQTSNDANGNRLVLASAGTFTSSLVNGTVSSTDLTGTWALGIEVGGSGSGAPDRAVDLVNQFLGATAWRQQVVVT